MPLKMSLLGDVGVELWSETQLLFGVAELLGRNEAQLVYT